MLEITNTWAIGAGTMGPGIAGQLENAGGAVDAGAELCEQEIFVPERKAFITFAQTPQTRARIEHTLSFGSPPRNQCYSSAGINE
jgi:hypothetical protein